MKKTFLLFVCLFLISYVPIHGVKKFQIKQKFDNRLVNVITEEGELIGWDFKSSSLLQAAEIIPFFYKDGQYHLPSFGPRMYPKMSLAYNTQGQVAFGVATPGWGLHDYIFDTQLALWNVGHESIILGNPEGWSYVEVIALTNKGQILIKDDLPKDSSEARIAVWDNGKFILIPPSVMNEPLAFVGDFIYGNDRWNDGGKYYVKPIAFNINNGEVSKLEFPENTALIFVDEQQCLFGTVIDIEKNLPTQSVYKIKDLPYSLLPETFTHLASKEGKVIGMTSKGEYFFFDIKTNELLSINENIIDEKGDVVAFTNHCPSRYALTYSNHRSLSINGKGEMVIGVCEYKIGGIYQTLVTYILSPVEVQ